MINTVETIENMRKFGVVVRIAYYLNKVTRKRSSSSLLRIAQEEFGLTVSQYQTVLQRHRQTQEQRQRRATLGLAA